MKKIFLLFVLINISTVESQEIIGKYNPFDSDIAIENFKACFPDESTNEIPFKKITYIGYEFSDDTSECPFPSQFCNENETYFKTTRNIHYNLNDLSRNTILAQANSHTFENCSYNKLRHFDWQVSLNEVNISYEYRWKKKKCTRHFGTHTRCKGRISGSTKVILGENFDFNVVPGPTSSSESCGLLSIGAIVSVFGPAGLVFKSEIEEKVIDKLGYLSSGFDYGNNSEIGGGNVSSLVQLIPEGQIFSPAFKKSNLSGLKRIGDSIDLQIIDEGWLLSANHGYKNNRREFIDFIENLSNPNTRVHRVVEGDSLWRLAEKYYGDGRAFLWINFVNELSNVKYLKPNQELIIPYVHDFCKQHKFNPLLVKNNESQWSKYKNGEMGKLFKPVIGYSGNPNLIYPFEILNEIKGEMKK